MKVEWARGSIGIEHSIVLDHINKRFGATLHWSRQFEYPWIILNGDFKPGLKILDAGGGHSPLQHLLAASSCDVTNVDLEPITARGKNFSVKQIQGDISQTNFSDGEFDRVICCSVLEHCLNPLAIINELCRVVKKDGKLLITFDVASYARYNHTIDIGWARDIVERTKLRRGLVGNTRVTPDKPKDILGQRFPELNPQANEPGFVDLNVICIAV